MLVDLILVFKRPNLALFIDCKNHILKLQSWQKNTSKTSRAVQLDIIKKLVHFLAELNI